MSVRSVWSRGVQSGILAAAGLNALEHHSARLADDHVNAGRLGEGLTAIPTLDVEPVDTNIVFVSVERTGLTAAELVACLRAAGVEVAAHGCARLRLATNLDATADDIDQAVAILRRTLA